MKESVFKYTGPSSLKDIEKRLLEIDTEKAARIHNIEEDFSSDIEMYMEADDIKYLDIEKTQLQLARQFILDKRESWLSKIIFSFITPITVAIITTVITSALIK